MTYPRTRNGWVDNGALIAASNRLNKCPSCGSSDYRETISMEKCNSCGLVCDYWGEGTNEVYDNYLNHKRTEERAEEEKNRKEEEADWSIPF